MWPFNAYSYKDGMKFLKFKYFYWLKHIITGIFSIHSQNYIQVNKCWYAADHSHQGTLEHVHKNGFHERKNILLLRYFSILMTSMITTGFCNRVVRLHIDKYVTQSQLITVHLHGWQLRAFNYRFSSTIVFRWVLNMSLLIECWTLAFNFCHMSMPLYKGLTRKDSSIGRATFNFT